MSPHRPRARATLVALLLVPCLLACGAEEPPEKPVVRPVKILEIGSPNAGRRLEYPGQVEAAQHAELGFEVAGKLVEFPVDEGEEVVEGQELAKLDPRDFEAGLDAERAQLRAAQADFDRMRELFERDVASEQELDRARRNFEVNEANLRTARKAIEDTVLRAPFAGTVARKLADDFSNVQAKEPVLILEDGSGLQIEANIPEQDWIYAERDSTPGQASARLRPRVVVSNYPDREFPARLKEVATTADPATRTYAITLAFSVPGDLNVLPGMTAKVVLDAPSAASGSLISIPAQAVASDTGTTPYVWRVDPGSMAVARAEVTLGEFSGDRVEIRGGLSPGDQIAVSGVHQLRDGMVVRRFEP